MYYKDTVSCTSDLKHNQNYITITVDEYRELIKASVGIESLKGFLRGKFSNFVEAESVRLAAGLKEEDVRVSYKEKGE